jgi:hypothetical protein
MALGVAALVAIAWIGCKPASGQDDGGTGAPQCPAPKAQLSVQVSAKECMACTRLAVFGQSPQITAAVASGHSPCSTAIDPSKNPPSGCLIGEVYNDTYADCGTNACGPYQVDLANDFLAAISGAEPAITDTVAFCPFDYDGTTFKPAGNCVSSFEQCDPSTTITLMVNGI